jgi:hypothetical protein
MGNAWLLNMMLLALPSVTLADLADVVCADMPHFVAHTTDNSIDNSIITLYNSNQPLLCGLQCPCLLNM